MNKFKKSSILVLLVLVLLLISTPLLPSSLRSTYLFFIFNLLIIALGAEAGLLSAFPRPSEDRKQSAFAFVTANIPEKREASTSTGGNAVSELDEKKPKVVKMSDQVKKCPSMPNLLYVGGGEAEAEIMEEEVELEDEGGGISEQEQFDKNEAFIGNFYKQLKLQRD